MTVRINDVIGGGGGRERLFADRTYYVRTTGNDANNGLTNTDVGAFLTAQRAADAIGAIDINGHVVTVQFADGTYDGFVIFPTGLVGPSSYFMGDSIVFQGNPANHNLVVLTTTVTSYIFWLDSIPANITFRNMLMSPPTGAVTSVNSRIAFDGVNFTDCTSGAIALAGGMANFSSNFTINSATMPYFLNVNKGAFCYLNGLTITLVGTPAWTIAGVMIGYQATLEAIGTAFAGTGATGKRYDVIRNGIINTNGGGAGYFPGNVGGTTATQGQYL